MGCSRLQPFQPWVYGDSWDHSAAVAHQAMLVMHDIQPHATTLRWGPTNTGTMIAAACAWPAAGGACGYVHARVCLPCQLRRLLIIYLRWLCRVHGHTPGHQDSGSRAAPAAAWQHAGGICVKVQLTDMVNSAHPGPKHRCMWSRGCWALSRCLPLEVVLSSGWIEPGDAQGKGRGRVGGVQGPR
jgi:hypothetical protein